MRGYLKGKKMMDGTVSRCLRTVSGLFACAGSDEVGSRVFPAVAAAIGVVGPIVFGVATGRTRMGAVASLGSLLTSPDERAGNSSELLRNLIFSLIGGTTGTAVGVIMGRHALFSAFALPIVGTAAAVFGGLSRRSARASVQFLLFLVIALHLGECGAEVERATLAFFSGAAWAGGLRFIEVPFRRAEHVSMDRPQKHTAGRLLLRWKKSLSHFSGWQYAFRIALCLAVTPVVVRILSLRHGYWVAVTVIIVVQHRLEKAAARTLHRAAGTLLGVLPACVFLANPLGLYGEVAAIAGLAAMRPTLIKTNYTAYAAVQTPLVILLLDFGYGPARAMALENAAIDRLAATFTGCCVAMACGYFGWARLARGKAPAEKGTATDKGGSL